VLVVLAQDSTANQHRRRGGQIRGSSICHAPNSANALIQEESFGSLSLTGKLRADGTCVGPVQRSSSQQEPGRLRTTAAGANLALS